MPSPATTEDRPTPKAFVKAMIEEQYGSLAAFERLKKLPRQSVTDVLRGRAVARTEAAIAEVVGKPLHVQFPNRHERPEDAESVFPDDTGDNSAAHRLNRAAI